MRYETLLSFVVVFAASVVAFRIGYKEKSLEAFSGVIGTLFIFAIYGFLMSVVVWIALYALTHVSFIPKGSNNAAISAVLTPMLMTPAYWFSVFAGVLVGRNQK